MAAHSATIDGADRQELLQGDDGVTIVGEQGLNQGLQAQATEPLHADPCASWITALSACALRHRGSRKPGEEVPCRPCGMARRTGPRRVAPGRIRCPFRGGVRSAARSWGPAPLGAVTSASIRACNNHSNASRRKAPGSIPALSTRSIRVLRASAPKGFLLCVCGSTAPETPRGLPRPPPGPQ
jgi:hypothetical protein